MCCTKPFIYLVCRDFTHCSQKLSLLTAFGVLITFITATANTTWKAILGLFRWYSSLKAAFGKLCSSRVQEKGISKDRLAIDKVTEIQDFKILRNWILKCSADLKNMGLVSRYWGKLFSPKFMLFKCSLESTCVFSLLHDYCITLQRSYDPQSSWAS